MQDAQANGLRLSYRLDGQRGPNVVLIHGLGGSAEATYGPVLDRLQREFRVLSFDNRGVGGSDKPGGSYALADFARDAYELMRSVGVERAHLVGHSLGGMIAQQVAVDYPSAALSLVLVDCAGELTDAGRANFEQRATAVEAGGTAAIVDAVIANAVGPQAKDRYPANVERFRQSVLASQSGPYAAACRAIATLDLLPRLGAYRGPVLVVRGDQDNSVTREAAQTLAAAFADGRYEEVSDSGHNAPFENPEAFTRLVVDFVSRTAAAGSR